MATRIDIDQASLLVAVLAHLRDALSLSEERCYGVLDPLSPGSPALVKGGDWWLTVSFGTGEFDGELFDGGGSEQLTESTIFRVAAYTKIKTDPVGKDTQLLIEATRGLLPIKRNILRALCAADVENQDNRPFLRELLRPLSSTPPMLIWPSDETQSLPLGCMIVDFATSFDWDLTAEQ